MQYYKKNAIRPVMIVGSRHIPPQPYLIAPQMENFILQYRKGEPYALA